MRETKVFEVDTKTLELKIDGDQGLVTAYASIFGNVDSGLDRVKSGAFTRSLKDRNKKIIYLPSHDYGAHIKDIPGVPILIEEDSTGLKTVTKFLLNTTAGKDSFEVLKAYQQAERPLGLSFTYEVVDKKYTKEGNKVIRDLLDLELYEYGHCALPMNEEARTTDVKTSRQVDADSKQTLSSTLGGRLYDSLSMKLVSWLSDETITIEQFAKVHSILGDSVIGLIDALNKADVGSIEIGSGGSWGWFSRDIEYLETDLKAGRVMSQRNLDQLHNSITNINKVHDATCDMEDCPLHDSTESASTELTEEQFNQLTHEEKIAAYYESLDEPDSNKAVWSTAYINNLPDSAFADIESGGTKDESGKTTPRSLRHYPHHDANGKLDEAHLKNALSRIGDSNNYQGGKAHLDAHAKAEGIGDEDGKARRERIDAILAGISL